MSQNIVIIGAVALGPKAACRFKRLEPQSTVTMVDQSNFISYGGCGIPYYVSGDVSDISQLQTTSFHMVRDPKFFEDVKGVDAMPRTQAVKIDREGKTVLVRNLDSGEEKTLPYDKLVIATGSSPRRLPLPGADLPGVHVVGGLQDAMDIRESVTRGEVERAVIVGAGFIGLEMAEALADMWGVEVTVVEMADQILPGLVSPRVAHMAARHMGENGVEFRFGQTVERLEGDGRVQRVFTKDGEEIEADLVILAPGVVPNDGLARDAGLKCHERGGIFVDEYMRTSDPDIYSGGDCAIIKHLVTDQPFFLPLGSMSNRQGRVIGDNLAGGTSSFKGAVGSFVVKLFERSVAGTGLSIEAAKRAGFDATSVLLIQLDRAHFYPEKELMTLEMVVEKGTRRVLGVQGFAGTGDAMVGRINAVAALLPNQPKVEDISNMELAYSPPFASAMDVLNSLGNLAENVLSGRNFGIGPDAFRELWENRSDDLYFLDCREEADARDFVERNGGQWNNIPQGELRKRLDEVPRDKRVVLVCNTGARSYEAQITLVDAGFEDILNLQGGMAGLKMSGVEV